MRKTLNIGSIHEQIGLVVDVMAVLALTSPFQCLGPDPRCDPVASMQPVVQVGLARYQRRCRRLDRREGLCDCDLSAECGDVHDVGSQEKTANPALPVA
jgi:hypothetical protein